MINYEVRNARGTVIRTFGDPTSALAWAKAHSPALCDDGGHLQAYAVETIRRERLLTEGEPVLVFKGAGGLRAGRGRR